LGALRGLAFPASLPGMAQAGCCEEQQRCGGRQTAPGGSMYVPMGWAWLTYTWLIGRSMTAVRVRRSSESLIVLLVATAGSCTKHLAYMHGCLRRASAVPV
jgi:hypothetical protein